MFVAGVAGAALVVAACGSSESEPEPQSRSSPAATATPSASEAGSETAQDRLERLPEVPDATESTRPPSSADVTGQSAFLRAAFDDVQAMRSRDFDAAGVPYEPAARVTG
jgi:hypothetical protein